jgi:hypothetical protein
MSNILFPIIKFKRFTIYKIGISIQRGFLRSRIRSGQCRWDICRKVNCTRTNHFVTIHDR